MKAAIYSRFSTDLQTESSIIDQVRVCTEYATRNEWRVAELFEDQGISGAALGNRPGALKMMEAALARRFDVLLVIDLSRLSRSIGDLSKMIDRLISKGVRVIGVQDGYDTGRKGHKLQAGLSGIIAEAFREMVKERTFSALEMRAKTKRPTGGRAFGYTAATKTESGDIEVNAAEAPIVREIFERFAEGASCKTIAIELNGRNVPSPGSSWNRTQRRARGWMGSAIRAMLRNPIYKGQVTWNTSEWRKDPDSGKRVRVARPQAEWVRYRNDELRIVSDELWQRAQRRVRGEGSDKQKCGGKPKYLLSGLLRCDTCGSHYTMADNRSYACSGHLGGHACSNTIRVRRSVVEDAILGPIKSELLAPERVEAMAKEMQRYFAERMKATEQKAAVAPKELQDLDARIARLRERLRQGDEDMAADEIQAAIDRAEGKRQELEAAQPAAKQSAKVMTMLPRAAELYRRQICEGLDGDARAALKARVILRDLFAGKISLKPESDGSLWAEFEVHPAVMLRGTGTNGSGGALHDVPVIPKRIKLK